MQLTPRQDPKRGGDKSITGLGSPWTEDRRERDAGDSEPVPFTESKQNLIDSLSPSTALTSLIVQQDGNSGPLKSSQGQRNSATVVITDELKH